MKCQICNEIIKNDELKCVNGIVEVHYRCTVAPYLKVLK